MTKAHPEHPTGFDAVALAAQLDASDPLRPFRDAFLLNPDVRSYLDGNSLGRPLAATRENISRFVEHDWGQRLIRGWGESWMEAPVRVGDAIGRVAIGAAAGQTVVADSTTVLLYKLIRAGIDARPGRRQVVVDSENFPTDRFILDGIAKELQIELCWIHPDTAGGVTADELREVISEDTALVVLSHVAYKSGFIADLAGVTAVAHDAGALILWDLSHSVGAIDVRLDNAGVDLAVGCTYKYLNGGPGAPAFAYVAERLHSLVRQPIQGWMGASDPFDMSDSYTPAPGIRQIISGTPPVLAMQPMGDMIALIEAAGISRIRQKSLLLTQFALDYVDAELTGHGVKVMSPREDALRGSHITLHHPRFQDIVPRLWARGVIPDYRPPSALRLGLSPLSTSFDEVRIGLDAVRDALSE